MRLQVRTHHGNAFLQRRKMCSLFGRKTARSVSGELRRILYKFTLCYGAYFEFYILAFCRHMHCGSFTVYRCCSGISTKKLQKNAAGLPDGVLQISDIFDTETRAMPGIQAMQAWACHTFLNRNAGYACPPPMKRTISSTSPSVRVRVSQVLRSGMSALRSTTTV